MSGQIVKKGEAVGNVTENTPDPVYTCTELDIKQSQYNALSTGKTPPVIIHFSPQHGMMSPQNQGDNKTSGNQPTKQYLHEQNVQIFKNPTKRSFTVVHDLV